jgi:integral membrane protein
MTTIFRITAFLEGLSYLILMTGSLLENETIIKMFGMPHGLLFLAYIALAIFLKSHYKWNLKDFAIVLIASLLPFGTFYVEKKYL